MNRRALSFVAAVAVVSLLSGAPALAQRTLQPTPPPDVTAESESWYVSGAPISFNGNIYYPAGPITHFLRNEMVRTGVFGTTPIYVRTGQEPGSIIYVPLSGGLVRPYERRRSGDLAGTVGSTAPSFPVVLPAQEANQQVVAGLRAAAPPSGVPVAATGTTAAFAVGTAGSVPPPLAPPPPPIAAAPAAVPPPVGTSGTVTMSSTSRPRTQLQTARRPLGLNDVYLEFQNVRWYLAGPAVEYAADRFTRIGDHRGFAVYQEKGRDGAIYVSHIPGPPGLLTPYRTR